jgi:rhomboid family GlyGly-CTERM serine protease
MITERLFHSSRQWLFAALASLLILVLQAGGTGVRFALQYDRAALQAGEWYRWLTAHWVHLDWRHAGMNVAGLWLLALIDAEDRPLRRGLMTNTLRCGWLSLAIGLALHLRQPQLHWYLGLSGVLHGLFVIVLVRALWWQGDRIALVALCILIGKLIWEHYHGALTQDALAAPVIVAAHSYGALAGLIYALVGVIAAGYFARNARSRNDTHAGD